MGEGVDGEDDVDDTDVLMGAVMGAKEVDASPVEGLAGEGGALTLMGIVEEALLDAASTGGFVSICFGRLIDGARGGFALEAMKGESKEKRVIYLFNEKPSQNFHDS